MDDELSIRPSVLKSLKKNKKFKLKQLLGDGKFTQGILLELFPNQEAIGKIVRNRNEGESTLWPNLRHESLIPLLDVVTIDEDMRLFVCPYVKMCLGLLIEEVSFLQHPKCFDRKKSYVRDVLSGIDYLHQLSLSLLNLTDQNILICSRSDKALISDFSCCVSVKIIAKFELPVDKFQISPPELRQLEEISDAVECTPIDMWLCGVMILQIFTRHVLPKIGDSKDVLSGLTIELLSRGNSGSYMAEEVATRLSDFLEPFLRQDPRQRIGAKEATGLYFLRSSDRRLDEQARDFWKMKDAFELLSNANKINVLLQKCVQKSQVHTIRDGNNFEYDVQVKALKTMCSENISSRKAKSELYAEKRPQHVEGKIQPHKSITFINYPYKRNNDTVTENSVEPHLFKDSIRLPCTAFYSSFDPFPCQFSREDFDTEFNSRQEKDPWGRNEESHMSSKFWPKTKTSSSNSETPSVLQDGCLSPISSSPSNCYADNQEEDTQETSLSSPISLQLAANQACEQFHKVILADIGHLKNTYKKPHDPCAYNAMKDIKEQGRFSNVSWRHEKERVGNISTVPGLTRRNACRFKKGTRLRYQLGFRPAPQHVAESVPPPNPRDVFVRHEEVDRTAFAFLLDGMHCYNLRRGENSERVVEKSKKRDHLFRKVPSRTQVYEVDVSLEQLLCSNVESGTTVGRHIKKPAQRWLRMLCPGSKSETESYQAFISDG